MPSSRTAVFILAALSIAFFRQFSSAEKAQQSPRQRQTLDKSQSADRGFDLPTARWAGTKFIVLEKQNLVRQFGYELYLSPELGTSKKKIDPAWETPQRHVRCDKIEWSYIIVKDVKPIGKDFLVKFENEQSKVMLFGKTRNGSIEGV